MLMTAVGVNSFAWQEIKIDGGGNINHFVYGNENIADSRKVPYGGNPNDNTMIVENGTTYVQNI
jgi:hypothetical protein